MTAKKKKPLQIQYVLIETVRPNPDNPRLIKDAKFKNLVKSLKDTPELFELRPLICKGEIGDLIILGGNMRYRAAKELKYKEVPILLCPDLTEEKEKEIIIKDNGDFGEWDFDILANEWSDLPLQEWGVAVPWTNDDTGGEGGDGGGEGEGDESTYNVLIECDGEADQAEKLERFEKEGLKCRALIS